MLFNILIFFSCMYSFYIPSFLKDDGEDVVIAEQHFSIKCPITQQTMTCPVRNVHCKHNYDRVGVRQLITNRGTKARYERFLLRLSIFLKSSPHFKISRSEVFHFGDSFPFT